MNGSEDSYDANTILQSLWSMSRAIKNEMQFTEFQKAALNRAAGKDGKRILFLEEAVAVSMNVNETLRLERAREEKEVKMNMRFLTEYVV